MGRFCLLLLLGLITSVICLGQGSPLETTPTAKIETTYDNSKDRTTVRLAPVQLSAERDKYHSLHMMPSFSFQGHEMKRPSIIDFELQSVVKVRLLDSDLYVVFIIDGETIHLSSSRSAIFRPVPGRRWMGERLVFRMPYETFIKITNAKQFGIKFEAVKFDVGAPQMQALRDLAAEMK
jgi:hypothetical protein